MRARLFLAIIIFVFIGCKSNTEDISRLSRIIGISAELQGKTLAVILVNTRADASCNIKKGDKIIYSCEGNVGKCEISKFGYTLECSGKLVAKDGESAGTE